PAPEAPTKQHTTVKGTPPADLDGRWLSVGVIELPNDRRRTVASLLEFTGSGPDLSMTERFSQLPQAQQKVLDAANAGDQEWKPSREDLTAVAKAWCSLPLLETHIATIETDIVARDQFDDAFKSDAQT